MKICETNTILAGSCGDARDVLAKAYVTKGVGNEGVEEGRLTRAKGRLMAFKGRKEVDKGVHRPGGPSRPRPDKAPRAVALSGAPGGARRSHAVVAAKQAASSGCAERPI